MDQSKFVSRLFDNKPIQVFPVRQKIEWKKGQRREALLGVAKCGHCKQEMNIAGFSKRLIVGATCANCLDRARLARVPIG